jgi:hypothetical protein
MTVTRMRETYAVISNLSPMFSARYSGDGADTCFWMITAMETWSDPAEESIENKHLGRGDEKRGMRLVAGVPLVVFDSVPREKDDVALSTGFKRFNT